MFPMKNVRYWSYMSNYQLKEITLKTLAISSRNSDEKEKEKKRKKFKGNLKTLRNMQT